jgi:hypothetical protein
MRWGARVRPLKRAFDKQSGGEHFYPAALASMGDGKRQDLFGRVFGGGWKTWLAFDQRSLLSGLRGSCQRQSEAYARNS